MDYKSTTFKELTALCVFILLFVLASVVAWQYSEAIRILIGEGGIFSLLVYFLFAVSSEVIAPVSSLPALPLAVSAWGSFLAAAVSWAGWLTGSMIAFALARRFGRPLVGRLVDLTRVSQASDFIPEKNLFWMVVFLRLFFPADIFSYALGLFSKIKWSSYLLATALGLAPFTFLFSYGLKISIGYQIAIGLVALAITLLFYRRVKNGVIHWIKKNYKK